MQAMSTSVSLHGADGVIADGNMEQNVAICVLHVQCAWNFL